MTWPPEDQRPRRRRVPPTVPWPDAAAGDPGRRGGDPDDDPYAGRRDPYAGQRDPYAGQRGPYADRGGARPDGGGDWSPPARPASRPATPAPRPRRRSPGRIAAWTAGILALVVLLAALAGWGVMHHYNGRIGHVDLALAGAQRPAAATDGSQNILLIGSDSRAGTGGAFGQVEGQRSDTTMLAHIAGDGAVTMVSFPRDLWVTIPAHPGSSGKTVGAQQSKLNAAFALGGPGLLVRTLENFTHLRVDRVIEIDLAGFQALTDAVGGVTVCVKPLPASLKARGFDNLHDKMSGWSGHNGENTLNGAQALAFVRQRYGLPESDLDRIRRQQQFLSVVFHKLTAPSTLANPLKDYRVLNAATSALTVDKDTSLTDLIPVAMHLRGALGGGKGFETIPVTPATRAGQSALVTDEAKLEAFLRPLRPSSTASARITTGTGAADISLSSATVSLAADATTPPAATSGEPDNCTY